MQQMLCFCPVSYTHLDVYKRQVFFQQRLQLLQEDIMLFLIQLAHFVQMTFERAASYKFVQYGLIDPGHRGGKKAALLFIPLQQRRRQHHKAYADRRRYGLGKCTDINQDVYKRQAFSCLPPSTTAT